MELYFVIEHMKYEAGHFTHAICSTLEKAERVKDWYQRTEVYIHTETVDNHPILKGKEE